jgi:hypothetical protein
LSPDRYFCGDDIVAKDANLALMPHLTKLSTRNASES